MAEKQIAPKDPEGQKKSSGTAEPVEKKSMAVRKTRRVKVSRRVRHTG